MSGSTKPEQFPGNTNADISSNPWFDLDLVNYRDQFASGYTRITADAGLQIFIPDRRDVRSKPESQNDNIQWFKDRNIPPPPQIVAFGHTLRASFVKSLPNAWAVSP